MMREKEILECVKPKKIRSRTWLQSKEEKGIANAIKDLLRKEGVHNEGRIQVARLLTKGMCADLERKYHSRWSMDDHNWYLMKW